MPEDSTSLDAVTKTSGTAPATTSLKEGAGANNSNGTEGETAAETGTSEDRTLAAAKVDINPTTRADMSPTGSVPVQKTGNGASNPPLNDDNPDRPQITITEDR